MDEAREAHEAHADASDLFVGKLSSTTTSAASPEGAPGQAGAMQQARTEQKAGLADAAAEAPAGDRWAVMHGALPLVTSKNMVHYDTTSENHNPLSSSASCVLQGQRAGAPLALCWWPHSRAGGQDPGAAAEVQGHTRRQLHREVGGCVYWWGSLQRLHFDSEPLSIEGVEWV